MPGEESIKPTAKDLEVKPPILPSETVLPPTNLGKAKAQTEQEAGEKREEASKTDLTDKEQTVADLRAKLDVANAQVDALTQQRTELLQQIERLKVEAGLGESAERSLQAANKKFEELTDLIGQLEERNNRLSSQVERLTGKELVPKPDKFEPGQRITTGLLANKKDVKPGSAEALSEPYVSVDTYQDKKTNTTISEIIASVGTVTGIDILGFDGENLTIGLRTDANPSPLAEEDQGSVKVKSSLRFTINVKDEDFLKFIRRLVRKGVVDPTSLQKLASSPKSSNVT